MNSQVPAKMGGLPYWEAQFDEIGNSVNSPDKLFADASQVNLTYLFVFSNGWNNSQPYARRRYEAYFKQMESEIALLGTPNHGRARDATIGVLGVIWPSMRWPDEEFDETGGEGAADVNVP